MLREKLTKISLVAATLGLALPGAAAAADLAYKAPPISPVAIAPSWTGFYLGISGGAGWGTQEQNWDIGATLAALTGGGLGGIPPLNSQSSHGINGQFVGGQVGYNYQMGWVVVGLQADAYWADIAGSSNCFVLGAINCNSKTEAFGTVTGRVGGTVDRALLYVKGGFAWEKAKSDINVLGLGGLGLGGAAIGLSSSEDSTRTGWTWGAGAEYMFTPNWTGFVEYNFLDFGTHSTTYAFTATIPGGPTLAIPFPTELKEQFHIVKAGVNYKF